MARKSDLVGSAVHQLGARQLFDQVGVVLFHQRDAMLQPLPAGLKLGAVTVNGKPYTRFADPETIDLSGATGHFDVVARRLP